MDGYVMVVLHLVLPLFGTCVLLAFAGGAVIRLRDSPELLGSVIDKLVGRFVFMLMFLYAMVSQKALSIFVCIHIGDAYWLEADVRQQCYTDTWAFYATLATGAIFLYIIGIPLGLFWILYMNRNSLTGSREVVRYGILYEGFLVSFYWGEIIEMLRKLGLVGMVMFVMPGSIVQSGTFFLICALFLMLHVVFNPLEDPMDNVCQLISLIGMIFTIFIVMMIFSADCGNQEVLPAEESRALLGFCLLLVTLVVLGLIMAITVATFYAQLVLIYVAAKTVLSLADSLLAATSLIGAAALSGAATNENEQLQKSAMHDEEHEQWLRDVSSEFSAGYGDQQNSVEGGLTLFQFATLLAAWDASGEVEEIKCTLNTMRGSSKAWEVSSEMMQLWVVEEFGLFDKSTCLWALAELLLPSSEQPRHERDKAAQQCVQGWQNDQEDDQLQKEDESATLDESDVTAGGDNGGARRRRVLRRVRTGRSAAETHGASSNQVSLKLRTWARQLHQMYMLRDTRLVPSDIFCDIAMSALGTSKDIMKFAERIEWSEEQILRWLQHVFCDKSHSEFLAAMVKVLKDVPPAAGKRYNLTWADAVSEAHFVLRHERLEDVKQVESIIASAAADTEPEQTAHGESRTQPEPCTPTLDENTLRAALVHFEDVLPRYFGRYDIDESGTIREAACLVKLTQALVMKLELVATAAEIDAAIEQLHIPDSGCSKAQFKFWFVDTFFMKLAK
jgi:hypothetical protein